MSNLGDANILSSGSSKEYSGVYAETIASKGSASLVNSILSAAMAAESSSSLSTLLDAANISLQSNPTAPQESTLIETTPPTLRTTSSGMGATETSEGPYTTATGDATTDATYLYEDIELILDNPGESVYLTDLLSLLISMGGYEQSGAYDGTTLNTELAAVGSDVETLGTALVDFDMVYTFYYTFWDNMGGDNQWSTANADAEAAVQAAAQSLVDQMDAAGMNASTPYFGDMYTEASAFADGSITLSWSPASFSGGIVVTGTSQYSTLNTVVAEQNAAYQATEVNGEYDPATAAKGFITSFETAFTSELDAVASAALVTSGTDFNAIMDGILTTLGITNTNTLPTTASGTASTDLYDLALYVDELQTNPSMGTLIDFTEYLNSMGENYAAGDYSSSTDMSSFLNSYGSTLSTLESDSMDAIMLAYYEYELNSTGSASTAASDTETLASEISNAFSSEGLTDSNPFVAGFVDESSAWASGSYFNSDGTLNVSSNSFLTSAVSAIGSSTDQSTIDSAILSTLSTTISTDMLSMEETLNSYVISALSGSVGGLQNLVSTFASTNSQSALLQVWELLYEMSEEPNSPDATMAFLILMGSMGATYGSNTLNLSSTDLAALSTLETDGIDELMMGIYYQVYIQTGSATAAESAVETIATQLSSELTAAGVTSSNAWAGSEVTQLNNWANGDYFNSDGTISTTSSDSFITAAMASINALPAGCSFSAYVSAISNTFYDQTFGGSNASTYTSLIDDVYDAAGITSLMDAYSTLIAAWVYELGGYTDTLAQIQALNDSINSILSIYNEPSGTVPSYSEVTTEQSDGTSATVYTFTGGFCDYTLTIDQADGTSKATYSVSTTQESEADTFMSDLVTLYGQCVTISEDTGNPLSTVAGEVATAIDSILTDPASAYMSSASSMVTFTDSSGNDLTLQDLYNDSLTDTDVYYTNSKGTTSSMSANEALAMCLGTQQLYDLEGYGSIPTGGTSILADFTTATDDLSSQSKATMEAVVLAASMLGMTLNSAKNAESQMAAINTQAVSNQTA
jgi:hypothetical protein